MPDVTRLDVLVNRGVDDMVPAMVRNSSSTSCLLQDEVGTGQQVGGEVPLAADCGESRRKGIRFGGEFQSGTVYFS